MRYAVILAGGSGKRVWPASRRHRPKQLLPLLGGRCLLELATDRLRGLFDNKNIYIITNASYADQVAKALPGIPRQNIIGEPEGRDTANAIALAVELLSAKDPDATMAVFTADHVIRPEQTFAAAVETAFRTAESHPDALVTFGIRPTWPHTGLGYIQCDKTIHDTVHEVLGFKEKPDHQTARRYVESGKYYWNSGMFVWKIGAIRKVLSEFLGESGKLLQGIGKAAAAGKDIAGLLQKAYPNLKRISIDYAVMEKASKVMMVELNCEWLDVGSWPSLETVSELDEAGNIVLAKNAVLLDSSRNIVVTEDDHLLAILGMDDCIVIRSPDVTLVCNKSDSQRIKELVELIEKRFGDKYV